MGELSLTLINSFVMIKTHSSIFFSGVQVHKCSGNVSQCYVLTNKQIKIPSIEESLRSVQVLTDKHIIPSLSTMKIYFFYREHILRTQP